MENIKNNWVLVIGGVLLVFSFVFSFNISVNSANADCFINSTLRIGSVGVEVQCLQTNLGITADGKFGPITRAAVIYWQTSHSLTADGIFGFRSRSALTNSHSDNAISVSSGPANLQVGETGTWQVGINSTYTMARSSWYVIWGDEVPTIMPSSSNYVYVGPNNTSGADNASKFYHAYTIAGVYHPVFIIVSQYGITDRTTTSVNVGNTATSSVTVTSPNGGETWKRGTMQTIRWQDNTPLPECSSDRFAPCLVTRDYNIRLVLYSQSCNYPMTCTTYSPVYTIAENVSGLSYNWTVGNTPVLGTPVTPPDGQYIIQVCKTNSTVCDSSNSYFTLTSSTVIPSITVLSPNGGQILKIGGKQTISYKIAGNIKPDYRVSLVLEPGLIPLTILPATSFSYVWTIPENVCYGGDACGSLTPGSYKITASLYDSVPCVGYCAPTGAKLLSSDESDTYFTITD